MGHFKSSLINGETLTHPSNALAVKLFGWYDNPQQAGDGAVQLQRLSEGSANMRKRQSGLHGNMQKSAEMTGSAKRVAGVIEQLHWKENKSLHDVAKYLNIGWAGLQWYIRRWELPVKPRLVSMRDKFRNDPDSQWTCWKGGKTIYKPSKNSGRKTHYAYVLDHSHPNANRRGYVPEHRLVMADFVGRPIADDEIVHHIDGDTLNNDLGNLELRKRGGASQYHGPLAACPHCGGELLSRG